MNLIRSVMVTAIVLLAAGCAWMYEGASRTGVSSSLVDFLYPEGDIPPEYSESVPNLEIPLRVGLAFVPGDHQNFSEMQKAQLLEKTRSAFTGYPFIKEIVTIPDAYLRAGGGWESLEQVSRLYQTDVVALVSYDQVANTAENKASLLYWTIVGAYVIEGTNQAIQTFVDTAVFDVRTHKLLFRAPGVHRLDASSTLVNLQEELRRAQATGFNAAFEDMNRNLATELGRFRERIKTEQVATVSYRESSGGGYGAIGIELLLLPWLAALARRRPY